MIRLAGSRPGWTLGFADEVWFSRLAQPALHAWAGARPRLSVHAVERHEPETALACYHSPEYQENIKVRLPHSNAELIIIEGYDGPQP